MKDFFHNYSYSSIKMFLNQFAISLFGSMLSMASTAAENDTLSVIFSIIAVLFYLFLIYTLVWEVGAKDRISVDIGKKAYRPHTGLWIALVANIPNFMAAVLYTIGSPFNTTHEWAGGMCVVATFFTAIFEGMYLGLTTTLSVGGVVLNRLWWSYFVIILPALIVAWIGYYLGFKNKKFTTLFDYQSPDKAKRK